MHALGIAAYVCTSSFASAATLTPAQLVAECEASLPASRALFARFRNLAAAKGLGIVTYESGISMMEQSAISRGSFTLPITQKFIAAHREPALRSVYVCRIHSIKLPTALRVADGTPTVLFSLTRRFLGACGCYTCAAGPGTRPSCEACCRMGSHPQVTPTCTLAPRPCRRSE